MCSSAASKSPSVMVRSPTRASTCAACSRVSRGRSVADAGVHRTARDGGVVAARAGETGERQRERERPVARPADARIACGLLRDGPCTRYRAMRRGNPPMSDRRRRLVADRPAAAPLERAPLVATHAGGRLLAARSRSPSSRPSRRAFAFTHASSRDAGVVRVASSRSARAVEAVLVFAILRAEESRLARELRTARTGTAVLRGSWSRGGSRLPFFARASSRPAGHRRGAPRRRRPRGRARRARPAAHR